MWVIVSTVVLLAFVAAHNVIGDTSAEPLIISETVLPADDKSKGNDEPVISLEYKPIKPSYLSSTSNVAQIVPPGQPWPASAAGYANFSQIKPTVSTKLETDDVPLIQSAPVPSTTNMINLDMSDPNTNFAEALEKVLAPELANVKISDEQQKISTSINVTPPPNADMNFIRALQAAVRVAVKKLVPSAGSSLRIAITKSSSGAIVNVKAFLDVIVSAAITPTLPPSTVPEIDLTKSSSGLLQNLQIILLKELRQAGYNADSKSIQNFSLSFSVLPPKDATKDYVRLYILGPLQAVLKRIVPAAAITSVSVNTQESNKQILRQTVTFKIQIVPPPEFEMNENVVEVPEIDLNAAGPNVISTVISTLQNQIIQNAAVNPTQAKTLSIPFKITPPKGATQQQIQNLYISPISQVLSKLDPTGKIFKITQNTLPNGDIVIIIYMNIPSTNSSSNGQIQPAVVPVVPQTATTSKQVFITTTTTEGTSQETEAPVNINNRNSFPEEDEIPPETTDNDETQTTKPSSNEVVPTNAIKTSVVDLTTPTASVTNVQRVLDEELSPLSNPVDDGQPKLLAIPFTMKPPPGATLQQIEENVVGPIGKLLTTLEPTGKVITSQTARLPNGEVESVIYFNISSIKDSKTYKDISEAPKDLKPSTVVPEQSIGIESTVTPRIAKEPVVSPVTKSQQTQEPSNKPENTVETSPIDLSHPNFDVLKDGIEQRLNEVIKRNPSKNGKAQTVGFPFVVPKEQATRIPIMTQAIATLLKGLVPSGKPVPTLSPKLLPNGDVEFTIYYEIPTIPNNKSDEDNVEEQTKPSVEPITPKAILEKKTRQTENEVQPKNALIISPIDLKQLNSANLPADIEQRVNEVRKKSNGQPQIIGFPFVLPGNQKPSFILTHGLKLTLQNIVPSGTIVQISEPKTLPNGDTEFIIYDELPAVTTEKPSEEAVEEKTEPSIVSEVIPETTPSQTQNEVQPENAVITSPIDLKELNTDNLLGDIQQRVNEVGKNSNGQAQIIGLPFIFPGKQKPSFLLKHAMKITLQNLLPSGTTMQISEPKTLPNGDTQLIIYGELPAVAIEKPSEEAVEEQTKKTVEHITPKVIPEPKTQKEVQPKNAIITSPIDLKQLNSANLPADIEQRVNEVRKKSNGQPQIIGFPFVLPGNQKPSFILTHGLKLTLQNIVQSGTIVQISEPKTLPNGDTEFIIYDELPAVTTEKPSEEAVEEKTEPSIVSEVIPETTPSQTQNEVQPENAVITSPIDLKELNTDNLLGDIQQRVNEVGKNINGQAQIIGLPFIFPGKQKPSFLLTHAMKITLQNLLPSGTTMQISEPKTLPNGDTQLIIYGELPAVAIEKPSEEAVEEQTKKTVEHITPKVIPEPKTQKEVQPKNAIITSPIDLKQLNSANLPADIEQRVNEVRKKSNGQPQIIGFPFVLPGNQKPSFILTHGLKLTLQNIVQSGTIVQISEPKTLPNGDTEFIIYDELPAVTTEKPSEEAVEEKTEPSKVSEVIPETTPSQTQNEVQPENAVITSPIDLKELNTDNLLGDIQQRVNEVGKNSNGQPQIIGLPFIFPGKQKPSFLLTHAMKMTLQNLLPSGTTMQISEPKTLPNGDTQLIIYGELPAVAIEKPSEEAVEEQTKKTVEHITPKVIPEPKTQKEVQPKNAIITSPIDLKQANYANLPADIEQRVKDVRKTSNGKPQVVGIPFLLSKNQKPNFFLTHSLKTVMNTLVPSGTIVQVSEPKTLPDGDTEFIIYDELPAVTNLKPYGRTVEKEAKPSVVNVNKEPIVFPTEVPNVISGTEVLQTKDENIPIAAVEDVNLDEPGATVEGEVGGALVKAITTISSNANDLNKPANLKFNIYTPLDNSLSQNNKVVNDVSSELKILEPNAKIITAKTNDSPQSNGPDGDVEIVIPSIASSRTAQIINNALKIPTIDINIPEIQLVKDIKDLLLKGLKSVVQLNPKGSQLFNLNFRLNPFDTKGSVDKVLKALKAVDPKGKIVSYKIRSGLDGLDYLEVIYLIPRLEDSIIYKFVKPKKPEIIYESFIDIDTRNPLNGLLEKVIKEEEAAEDEVQGATKGQLIDLPLDFKFTNSRGLSDSRVGEVISQTLPRIEGYIGQILPKGKIISADTVNLPNSDDVVLKIVVKTPYEPDNTIVIDEVRPQVRTVVTTPKPKSGGLFGILGF